MTVDLHRSFDNCRWFLVPIDLPVIQALLKGTVHAPPDCAVHQVWCFSSSSFYSYLTLNCQMLNTNKFCYRLIPLPPMRTTPISIYSGEYPTSTSLANFNHVKYPFDTLPTVTSHIYPHYIVYDTGKKLAHFFGEDLDEPCLPDMPYDTWVKGLDMGSAYLGVLKDCHALYS